MAIRQKHDAGEDTPKGIPEPSWQNTAQKESSPKIMLALVSLLALTVLVQAFNFTEQGQINSQLERQWGLFSPNGGGGVTGAIDMSGWTENDKMNYEMHGVIPAQAAGSTVNPGANASSAVAGFIDVSPKGIPRIYGAELGVSFDDVSPSDPRKADETIALLSQFDKENSGKFIELEGEKLQRYIKISSQISCEYCCGAESIIFPNGQAACGCAHSYSMRGLAKYLLDRHAGEFTDDQILEEMGKWKTLYFPGALSQKAQVLKGKGIELNYINLASNKYRGIEKGAVGGGAMVGGC
ncbi:MAG: hypothetical protein HY544_02155 [Candidatus Diapherotrites archaeon]|uniref:Uncharacterized protein n=1 Tax=Candidatus Iainarchaeum sp. TaxID=3101447 RepID=A0A8T3YML8_9ARCH|nr:hypothetical protein [Candidatus Diapherotrites archaeon]